MAKKSVIDEIMEEISPNSLFNDIIPSPSELFGDLEPPHMLLRNLIKEK